VSSKAKFKFKHLKSKQFDNQNGNPQNTATLNGFQAGNPLGEPNGNPFGETCNIWKGPLNNNDKQVILNAHNWFRNQIALQGNTVGPRLPFAKNMLQMYWSDAIAAKAQLHANNCKFRHSTRDFRRLPDFPTGENIYTTNSIYNYQPMDWNRSITAWFNEIKDFGGKNVDSLQTGGPVTGHFTQVVWANSYLVGCGFAQYKTDGWFTNLYVCQYGPVGNVIGNPIYSSSPSRVCVCPQGTSCSNSTYSGLCCPTDACTWQSQTYSGPTIPGTVPQNLTYGP